MRILIFGATGMLGSTLLRFFIQQNLDVQATVRDYSSCQQFPLSLKTHLIVPVNADDVVSVRNALSKHRPDVVINCIGLIKQLVSVKDATQCIEINALFPHRLASVCEEIGSRLIHVSTDCVFSGRKGMYSENDFPDCDDLYGRTKLLGEVDYPHAITLRTSIIGHEMGRNVSLVDWFLSQQGRVRGFTKAIYSGLPTVEMARIIADVVIPNQELSGLYHVSSAPVSKYELLRLVAQKYEKDIEIEPYDEFVCDRSLDSSRFRDLTNYTPPSWQDLVAMMHADWVELQLI